VKVDSIAGPNPWRATKDLNGEHACYFCHPELYPDMPDWHSLCARCGGLIRTAGLSGDPMNEAMIICEDCESDLDKASKA